jgi:hypothetical protein
MMIQPANKSDDIWKKTDAFGQSRNLHVILLCMATQAYSYRHGQSRRS